MKRFVHILLVLALFAQALSAAGFAFADDSFANHELEHWQKASHHHHDDGESHHDESVESRVHVLQEGNLVSLSPFIPGCDLPHFQSPMLPQAADDPAESPYLEGIRRPPRSRD